jgi:hypothetical protein
MARQDDLSFNVLRAPQGIVEIIDFKPQQQPVPVRFKLRIADSPMVMFNVKAVQLQHNGTVAPNQALILSTTVGAQAAQ